MHWAWLYPLSVGGHGVPSLIMPKMSMNLPSRARHTREHLFIEVSAVYVHNNTTAEVKSAKQDNAFMKGYACVYAWTANRLQWTICFMFTLMNLMPIWWLTNASCSFNIHFSPKCITSKRQNILIPKGVWTTYSAGVALCMYVSVV